MTLGGRPWGGGVVASGNFENCRSSHNRRKSVWLEIRGKDIPCSKMNRGSLVDGH